MIDEGIKFLDKNYPNWRSKINIEALDMADGYNCIEGQLEKSAYRFNAIHKLSYNDCINLGFECEPAKDNAILTKLWRGIIECQNHK